MKFINVKKTNKNIFIIFILLGSLIFTEVKSSDKKYKEKISSEDFEEVFIGDFSPFDHDDIFSHFRKFLGLNTDLYSDQKNFSDLIITDVSKNLRELYEAKLNQITSSNRPDIIESFFKEKL